MMKLVNYDERTLILQNLRPVTRQINKTYTKAQYRILCNLIRQKRITEPFFMLVLSSLYGLNDWKLLFCKLNDAPVVTLNDAVTV